MLEKKVNKSRDLPTMICRVTPFSVHVAQLLWNGTPLTVPNLLRKESVIVIYLLSSWSILIFGKLFFICFCPFPSIIPLDRGWGRGFGGRRFSVSGFSLGWAWGRSPFAAILGTIFPSRPIKIRPFSINPIHLALHKGTFISRKRFCYLK